MSKNVYGKCLRCGSPVYEEKATVCSECKVELTGMHEKAEAFYAAEYAAEVGSIDTTEYC